MIILGAGSPLFPGHQPSIQHVDRRRRVLDWIKRAFKTLDPEICFVGGYDVEQVIASFPGLDYRINNDWEHTGAVASLSLAPIEPDRDHFICYSDILFRSDLVSRLASLGNDVIAAAIDTQSLVSESTQHRDREALVLGPGGTIAGAATAKPGQPTSNLAEFVGLIRVPAAIAEVFRDFVADRSDQLGSDHISALFPAWLKAFGDRSAVACETNGLWTSLEDNTQLSRFILGSKATTLSNLQGILNSSEIAPLVHFTRADWLLDPEGRVEHILGSLGDVDLIVRSSASVEDGFTTANAGRFLSLPNVTPSPQALAEAIARVLGSYEGDNPNDQVLVQPMIEDVVCSGVVFTRVLSSGAPYIVINLANGSDTTSITAGTAENDETVYVYRRASGALLDKQAPLIRRLVGVAREIENLVDYDALDIEFALDRSGKIYTLQVRPMTSNAVRYDRADDEAYDTLLSGVHRQISALEPARSMCGGEFAAWSCMTDWNPAEMIGAKPQPLALSLYRYLITDEVWAEQRAQCGYRDLRPLPLVRSFAGYAYVDVRASLNSFVPAALPSATARKLVNSALDYLRQAPHLHDKVEFDVMPTCIDLNLGAWLERLESKAGFTAAELREFEEALACVTTNIIRFTNESLAEIRELEGSVHRFLSSAMPPFEQIRTALYHCRKSGTLAFAHAARGGFVAASWLRSAVQTGLLDRARVDAFLASLSTVSSCLSRDAWQVRQGNIPWAEFVKKYGHLRPGTYDITSPCYRDHPDEYLKPIVDRSYAPQPSDFAWLPEELQAIGDRLAQHHVMIEPLAAGNFLRDAIIGREYAKFVFTRLLSAALDQMRHALEDLDLPPGKGRFLDINDLLYLAVCSGGSRIDQAYLEGRIKDAEARNVLHRLAVLPPVFFDPDSLYCFTVPHTEPNYVTMEQVEGTLVVLDGSTSTAETVQGCIVAVRQADPGYDWIFGLGAMGLITAFGGANSHMAVRAAEFGMPAVIGIGEQAFDRLKDGMLVQMDCAAQRLSVDG